MCLFDFLVLLSISSLPQTFLNLISFKSKRKIVKYNCMFKKYNFKLTQLKQYREPISLRLYFLEFFFLNSIISVSFKALNMYVCSWVLLVYLHFWKYFLLNLSPLCFTYLFTSFSFPVTLFCESRSHLCSSSWAARFLVSSQLVGLASSFVGTFLARSCFL